MNNKAIFIAIVACGLGVWSLVKLYQVEGNLEDQIVRIDDNVAQSASHLKRSFSSDNDRIQQSIDSVQSESDSQGKNLAEYEHSLSISDRNSSSQLQDISFLKSQRIDHDKRIGQLFNELQTLKRDNRQLKNDISRLRSELDRLKR